MGIPYITIFEGGINPNEELYSSYFRLKGKGALILRADDHLLNFHIGYSPLILGQMFELTIPEIEASPVNNANIAIYGGWTKEVDLPEGDIRAYIDSYNISVSSFFSLYFVPNGF